MESICILLLIFCFCLICTLIMQKIRYSKRLNYHEKQQIELNSKCINYFNEKQELSSKCDMYFRENEELKKQLKKHDDEEYEKLGGFQTTDGKIKIEPIYEGKRALIGDYLACSYKNTRKVLKSLGFEVDVVPKKEDVVNKIKYENNYDIIFSNNVYPDGSGAECLNELKQIKNFSTPVVIHTITKDKREFFINTIGFDDYIVKPLTQENIKPILSNIFNK